MPTLENPESQECEMALSAPILESVARVPQRAATADPPESRAETAHAAANEARGGEEGWGNFLQGDLVLIEGMDERDDWELIERTVEPGMWRVRLNGTWDYAEYPADLMTLSAPVEDVDDPFAEQDDEVPSDEQITAYLDSLTDEERQELAGPLPVRWLYPWKPGEPKRALNLFAGCGGWCAGLRRVLGCEIDMVCLDLNADAVATSTAAGCTAVRVDVTTLDPGHWALRWTHILIGSPPCTDWTLAGKRLGHLPRNIEILLSAIVDAGEAAGNVPLTGVPGDVMTYKSPADLSWSEVREALGEMSTTTAGLMLEMVVFTLGLWQAGALLETVAMEQSSALPHEVRMALWAELELAGWATNQWVELDAADYGSPSHRKRWFHLASNQPVDDSVNLDVPLVTLASEAIGCAPDLRVVTRGNRRTSGGNAFVMGRQIPGVTSKIRGWDVGDGGRFSLGQMALLVGMPAEHPLVGSRTSAAQQLSDVVCPAAAAAVLGVLLGLKWRPALRRYLAELYPSAHAAEHSLVLASSMEIPAQCSTAPARDHLALF